MWCTVQLGRRKIDVDCPFSSRVWSFFMSGFTSPLRCSLKMGVRWLKDPTTNSIVNLMSSFFIMLVFTLFGRNKTQGLKGTFFSGAASKSSHRRLSETLSPLSWILFRDQIVMSPLPLLLFRFVVSFVLI